MLQFFAEHHQGSNFNDSPLMKHISSNFRLVLSGRAVDGFQNRIDFGRDLAAQINEGEAHVSACGCRSGQCWRGTWAWCSERRAASLVATTADGLHIQRLAVVAVVVIKGFAAAINAGARLGRGQFAAANGLLDCADSTRASGINDLIARPAPPCPGFTLVFIATGNAMALLLVWQCDSHLSHRLFCGSLALAHLDKSLTSAKSRVLCLARGQVTDNGLLAPAVVRDLLLLPALRG